MKVRENLYETMPFGGIFGGIAEALGGPPRGASAARSVPVPAKRPGWFARIGERIWRRKLRSVDADVARSDDIFASLDRWLWKQRMRETEAWLAESADLFELEARIRQLERGRTGRAF